MTETNPGSSRIWWILALVFVSGWCLYLFFFGPRPRGSAPTLAGTALSKPADYNWSLYDLQGRTVSFADYRGKTVFLNVWATWCGPCVAELPSIARLARTPRLDQVAFVCVSVDQDPETVRRYVQGKDWPMTVLHATRFPSAFSTDGIPATFLIAPDGRIAASYVGGAAWDDPTVVDFIERLAPAKVEPPAPAEPR